LFHFLNKNYTLQACWLLSVDRSVSYWFCRTKRQKMKKKLYNEVSAESFMHVYFTTEKKNPKKNVLYIN